MNKTKEVVVQEEAKFSKAELLNAKKYSDKKDVVEAVIPGDFYGTIADADSLIEKFMKKAVK